MIKIINGTFGFRKGAVVIPLTKDSEPIELPKDLEKRLVEVDKIAEYVNAPKQKADKPQYDRAALIARYKELGLPGNPGQIKNEVLDEAIKQAEGANKATEEDNASKEGENQPSEQPDEVTEIGETNSENLVPENEKNDTDSDVTIPEDVKEFLNGETDKLPEGTEIISEEEALKLAASNAGDENKGDDAPDLTGDGIAE